MKNKVFLSIISASLLLGCIVAFDDNYTNNSNPSIKLNMNMYSERKNKDIETRSINYSNVVQKDNEQLNGVRQGEDGNWYCFENGSINFSCNDVLQNENGWWYIENGQVKFGFDGIAANQNGEWYINKGKVDFSANNVLQVNCESYYGNECNKYNGWFHLVDGKLLKEKTVAANQNGWWYINDLGKVDFDYNGIGKNGNGLWCIENGKVNLGFTGIKNCNGIKYYCESGRVCDNITNVVYINGDWYYVQNGIVYSSEKPTVASNENGWWYIGTDGKVNFEYNGIASNINGTYVIENGKVNLEFTGIMNCNGIEYYCESGRVCDNVTDVVNVNGDWYYVQNGIVYYAEKPTVANNENGWWYIGTDGKVDFGYNGIASNANGMWYLKNGKVSFEDNLVYTDPLTGKIYSIVNGKATLIKNTGEDWELPIM